MFSNLRRVLVALSIIAASSAAVKVAYAAESDGTVDLGFGSSGVVSLSGTQYKNQLELSTGKVVMFAEVESDSNSAGPDSIKIVSLNADGTMNNSFGTSGILNIQVSTFSYYQFEKAVADSSGGFYLAFYANDPQSGFSRMARITSAGVVDTNFGTNGVVTIPKQQASGSVKSINVDASTGNIYAFSEGSQTEIVRLTAAGALDLTFNNDSFQEKSLQPWPGSGFCSSMWRVSIVDVWVDASESYAMVYALKEGPTNTRVLGVAKYDFSTETCDTTFGGDLFASNGSTRTPDSSPDGFYEYAFGGTQNPSAKLYVQVDGSVFGLLKNDAGALYVAKFTAAGLLDSNFGTGGKTIDISGNFGSAWGMTYALAVAPNGAITVVGPPSGSNFATLVRLFSYGAIDIGFGSSGTVSVPTCTNVNYQGALRLSDGSIIAVSGMGSGSYPNTVYTTYVVKLGSGGSSSQCGTTTTTTQPNYGNGGGNTCSNGTSLTPSSRTVSGNVGEALTVPAPVAAGFSSPPTYTQVNGSYWPAGLNLDSSTGVVSGTPATSAQYMTSSITVASGSQTCSYNITWNITRLACVTGVPTIGGTNPTLDTSFGTGGAIEFATTGMDNSLQGGVATSDGNLVVAESVEVSGDPVIKFRKYSPAGTLVSSFGTGGVLTIDKSSGAPFESADAVAELSDGSLIALYTVRTFGGMNAGTQNYLLKLTSNGAVDTSFGTSGYAAITAPYNANIRNLEVLSNDSVIVLVTTDSQGATINELKKFTSTGVADSAFGTSGTLTLSQSEHNFTVNSADSILVGGSTGTSPSSATVKKYTSAGVLDTAWATSGVVTLTGVGSQGDSLSVMSVATDASNKIYVAVRASTMQSMNSTSKLFRLLADGTNDSSFGSGTLLSSPSSPYVQEILVLADGNVVLSSMNMGMTPEAGVSLVSSSGVLDSSHATNTASLAFGNCALSDARIAQLTTGEVMAFGATYVNSGDSTGSLWKLNFSGVTGGSGSGSNTGTGSNTETPSGAAAPTLVTSANAAALVRAPGSESIIVNGQEVVIESNNVNIPAARTPAAQRTVAQVASIQQAGAALLQQFLASLPAGATSTVTVVNTATGAVMQNLVFDANGNSVNVPVEDIVFLDGPQLSLMIGSNNANITADGKYQVGAGGIVGVTGSGLGASANGEIIAMSTPTLLANFQTTAAGDFTKSATLPASIGVGDHTLVVATGTTYAMMGIRVVPAALPTTGTSSDQVVIIALFTLVFGALFFRGRRTFAL